MQLTTKTFLALGAVCLVNTALLAQETTDKETFERPENTFASQGTAVLTHEELYSELNQIPEQYRLAYIRDGERVNTIVGQMLRYKSVVEDATKNGFDQNPEIQIIMRLAAEKALAEEWIKQVMRDAPEADYEAMAHEYYLGHPENFQTPEFVDVTHILISSEERGDEAALELASSLKAQLDAEPALFDEFVLEYSEDPSKSANAGTFPSMKRGDMVKPFEDASFALETPGEISDPVQTAYGYHVIRFNNRYPPRLKKYEDVKEEAIEAARGTYLEAYRSRYIRKLVEEPIDLRREDVEKMARKYFGDDLELAPDFTP